MIIVDIDNTICTTIGTDYKNAKPNEKLIKKLNDLHDKGLEIIYWTARGSKRKQDYTTLTLEQFVKWKVKCTKLIFEKPNYAYFICDKSIKPDEFLKLKEVKA